MEKRDKATIVHLFEKRKLFAAGLSPRRDDFFKTEKTERRRIEVEGNPVAMNFYCLLDKSHTTYLQGRGNEKA